MVLLSAEVILPAVEPALYTLMTTRRLNNAILERHIDNFERKSLASPVVQSNIKVDWMERLLLLCEIREDHEPQSFVWEKMEASNRMLAKDGEVLRSKEDNMAQLDQVVKAFRSNKLPLLRQLGVF